MHMRVTISLDKDILEEAKNYAKETGRTFSGLIEISLKSVLSKKIMGDEDE